MAGPSPDSFQRALHRFKQTLPPSLVDEFSICTLHDVRNICRDIQHSQREGKLQHMRRLKAFIEAMEQFGQVVQLFANANEIVCFVWGPMKFLLGIASSHVSSFDKLLDVYDQLGNAIPGLAHYQTAFQQHSALATVLEDYYSDILEFHRAAISVFKRPKWKELLHSTWKTFDSKFGPILQSLSKRRELLESEKGSATLYEIQSLRQEVSDMCAEQRRRAAQRDVEKHRREVSFIREKLEAPSYQIDQEMSTEDRYGRSSGMWIFENPDFSAWFNSDVGGHGVLYVNGIPGAGKTTLMSAVIEKLLSRKCSESNKHCVAYFYFKQKQQSKESHNSLLRAVLDQLIDRDPTMSDHLFEKISSLEGVTLRSTKILEELVKTALESYRMCYILLDGLDECAANEAEKSVKWFLSLMHGGLEGSDAVLRVLFCGQRDGTLDKLLAGQASISLETSGHVDDIRQYCRDVCRRIRDKFNISPVMEEDIILRVVNEAQGMFLYARVVLENLVNQTQLSRLRQEMEPGTFPEGIEKAYERVAVRIFEASSRAKREDAIKILGWITCARRLLRWREIQAMFCIDPINGVVEYEERRLRDDCKELCGSLIDVHHATDKKTGPEDVIKIVHETAREYLIRSKWLDISLEHARLAIFCSTYLTSKPFIYGMDEGDIAAHAVKGYYALQDYAVQYWFDHFWECSYSLVALDLDQLQMVTKAAQVFLESYGLPSKIGEHHSTDVHEGIARSIKELPQESSERNTYLNIELRTVLIRNTIETLHRTALDPDSQHTLSSLHGPTQSYKCTKPWCESFTAGFETAGDRNRHTNRHDLPFYCPFEGCFAYQLAYDTEGKLQQHKQSHHPEPEGVGIKFPNIATRKVITLAMAAAQGDLATVKALLDSGEHVDQGDKHSGWKRPLFLASKSGYFEVCKFLLERGARIDSCSGGEQQTALHAAVMAGNLDIIHLLASQGKCRPDTPDAYGRSPFLEACALGHLDIVKFLLETGKIKTDRRASRDPDCCNNTDLDWRLTPLGYACSEGHFAVVHYLLQQGKSGLVDVDMISRAAQGGHEAIVDLLRPLITEPYQMEDDWYVTSNPALPRVFNIELVHTLLHDSEVKCVRFSSDGKYLATGSDRSANIYDVATREKTRILHDHTALLTHTRSVCFSPDGKYLATGGTDKLIRVWDIATGTVRNTLSGHSAEINSIDFSRNCRIIASGSRGFTVRLWDIELSINIMTFNMDCPVLSVAISPNTKLVAAVSSKNVVEVWDSQSGHLIQQFNYGYTVVAKCFAFSPNEWNLVSGGGRDDTIKTWEIMTPSGIANPEPLVGRCIKVFERCPDYLTSVAFTPDAEWVLSTSADGIVRMWDSHTGQPRLMLKGHKQGINSVATSPIGGCFATRSEDGCVRIWSYNSIHNE